MKQRNLKDQILDVHGRTYPVLTRGASVEYRLREMSIALRGLPDTAHELHRHFPVSAVALLETFFRQIVAHVIDRGPEFLERGLALIADKPIKAQEALSIVQSGIATPGQLVAHLLPCSAVAHIERPLDAILGLSIKQSMKTAVLVAAVRPIPMDPPPLAVKDVPALWKNLTKLFEQRHILAHEAAIGYEVTATQAWEAVDTVDQFIAGVDAVLWQTAWKDEPLTHREMTDRAYEDMVEARKSLAALIRAARRDRRIDRPRQVLWRKYFLGYMDGYGDEQMGGVRLLYYFGQARKMLQDQIDIYAPPHKTAGQLGYWPTR